MTPFSSRMTIFLPSSEASKVSPRNLAYLAAVASSTFSSSLMWARSLVRGLTPIMPGMIPPAGCGRNWKGALPC